MNTKLSQAYKLIAELLSYPEELDMDVILSSGEKVTSALISFDKESAEMISQFIKELSSISPETYVELFELAPQCPLYLGYYGFKEPTTCAAAGDSDRNHFMLEIANIYKHYGLAMNDKDLPDFLPAMLEFLWLTDDREDRVPRATLIKEFILPFLPDITQKLEKISSPYAGLLKALKRLLNHELNISEEIAYAKSTG